MERVKHFDKRLQTRQRDKNNKAKLWNNFEIDKLIYASCKKSSVDCAKYICKNLLYLP